MISKSTLKNLFVKLDKGAIAPKRASKYAAGFDIYSFEDKIIEAKNKGLVKTGVRLKVPEGYYGRIAPRSGLASKNFIDVGAGVIDSDYRGEVSKGDRIAQLIIEAMSMCDIELVEDLDETKRGEGGFGSTGVGINDANNSKDKNELKNANNYNDNKDKDSKLSNKI